MIQESQIPFASPVLLVKKKTGDWRMCVDYRRLNALTVKNRFPLHVFDEFVDELYDGKWFTTLDMASRYHQVLVDPADRYKTAFQTHHGHYEYVVMPYGVTSGPATFQHEMNSILAPFLRHFVVVFIDDILIYSQTYEDHVEHIKLVFLALQQHKFRVKLSKSVFAWEQLSYLGHNISSSGISTDPKKSCTCTKVAYTNQCESV